MSNASGRPAAGEYAGYAEADFAFVEGNDAVEALRAASEATIRLVRSVEEPAIDDLRYAPGKWTFKQVLGHLTDDERVFAYRALCVARRDPRTLAGFDENDFVAAASFDEQPLHQLLRGIEMTRASSIAFFSSLSAEEWLRRGMVNGYEASVRGLAFHIAAHELHHLRVLRERYLPLIPEARS